MACNRMSSSVSYRAGKIGVALPTAGQLRKVADHAKNGIKRPRFHSDVEQLLNQLSSLGSNMKTTFFHIKKARKQLLTIMSAIESKNPTWFLTFSSADYCWVELWIAIKASKGEYVSKEDASKIPYKQRLVLLDQNPALACRCFKERIMCMLNDIMRGSAHPIGFIIDWWFRIEFQNRGSLHCHSIIWALLFYHGKWYDGDELTSMMKINNNDKEEISQPDLPFQEKKDEPFTKEETIVVSTNNSFIEDKLLLPCLINTNLNNSFICQLHSLNLILNETSYSNIGMSCCNILNTCWLSSLLQCLVHCNPLVVYMNDILESLTEMLSVNITMRLFELIIISRYNYNSTKLLNPFYLLEYWTSYSARDPTYSFGSYADVSEPLILFIELLKKIGLIKILSSTNFLTFILQSI